MNWETPEEKKVLSALRTWYLVGILGFSFSFTFAWFRYLTPLSLLLLGLVFWLYHHPRDRRFYLVTACIFLAGFLVEVAGVQTGKIFGVYSYGRVLGPKVAGTPLIIGLNWVILVYGALAMASLVFTSRFLIGLFAALFMTASDLVIERFAILSGMWSWAGEIPPLQNYLAWFVLSFLFCLLAQPLLKGMRRPLVVHATLYQLVFFSLVLIIHSLLWN